MPFFPRAEHLAAHLRARRVGMPAWRIGAATARRLDGDWQGACAAAGIAVEPSLWRRIERLGLVDTIGAQLPHLAPDLLRWHLPRVPDGLDPRQDEEELVLADRRAPSGIERHRLCLVFRWQGREEPRLVLRTRLAAQDWRYEHRVDRAFWDVREPGALRERCGDSTRTAFYERDGSPAPVPDAPPAGGAAVRTLEWATTRWDAGDIDGALAAYGLSAEEPQEYLWRGIPLALDRVAARAHEWWRSTRQSHLTLSRRFGWAQLEFVRRPHGPVLVSYNEDRFGEGTAMYQEQWQRLPDWDLLRHGMIRPEELHPLVHRSLFPDAAQVPPFTWSPDLTAPVLVPCGGGQHEVRMVDGRLRFPHDDAELVREEALSAMGAPVRGCAAARLAWYGGGKLPPGLDEWRRQLFGTVFADNVPGLRALLEAGFDPGLRGTDRLTVHHHLTGEQVGQLRDAGLL
ncbi:hypothetical protein Val02_65320 [Virgisporangium aliadipatigenens]|uniref:Uncharacterized protein n=1 Tax=Virgisporangium aliadipatigenens TaxID=741659 RepID=A0A8J4DTT9_9ACTN|nr:hypothetical protein [Virgisporangium aliadipatigenens]GIJ49646.1 hypothetical protein Val02_65320 [Virgisporangium aliadipatigenens]